MRLLNGFVVVVGAQLWCATTAAQSPPAPASADPTNDIEPGAPASKPAPPLSEAPSEREASTTGGDTSRVDGIEFESEPRPFEPEPKPEEPVSRGKGSIFSRGRVRLSLIAGSGSAVDHTYLILGGGVGYFLLDGLEVGVDYEAWLLGKPVLHRLSPETRYVFYFVPTIKPYVGAFYRHTFVTGNDGLDHVGARVGGYFVPGSGRFYFGVGAVYERLLSCDASIFDCDSVYPEISIAFGL
jgi:hypothetical protein